MFEKWFLDSLISWPNNLGSLVSSYVLKFKKVRERRQNVLGQLSDIKKYRDIH